MKFLVRFLILLLVPLAILAGFYGWVVLRSPAADSAPLVRTTERKLAWLGEPVKVSLHFNGDQLPGRLTEPDGPPNAVILVLDRSGSMGSGEGSPLASATSAASYFAQVVASPRQPLAVLAFDDRVESICALGEDGQACAESILAIDGGGQTDLAAAINAGHRTLIEGRTAYPQASSILVLLSDGGSPRQPALAAAQRARDDGVRILTIALGSQIDEELLRGLASSPADYRHTLDASVLGTLFLEIAGEMAVILGHAGRLSEQYHYGAFTLDNAMPGLQPEHNLASGRLEVDLPVLFARRFQLSYTERARKVGLFSVALEAASLSYVPDPDEPQRVVKIDSASTPPILVVSWFLLALLFLPALAYAVWRLVRFIQRPQPLPRPEIPAPRREVLPPPLPRSALSVLLRQLEPVLFVGLGKVGGEVLERIAGTILAEEAADPGHQSCRFLHIDGRPVAEPSSTAPASVWRAQLPATVGPAVASLDGRPVPEHLRWLPEQELRQATSAELDLTQGARGNRWVARLALFEAFKNRHPVFWEPWNAAVTWLCGRPVARVVVVGSAESGTGSGLLADTAYLLCAALPEERRAEVAVYGLVLTDLPALHDCAADNQYALLHELDREQLASGWSRPRVYDPEASGTREYLNRSTKGPIFSNLVLLQAADASSSAQRESFLDRVAALCQLLTEAVSATALEQQLDAARPAEQRLRSVRLETAITSIALHRYSFPARELMELLSDRFVLNVVGDLAGIDSEAEALELPPWTPAEAAQAESLLAAACASTGAGGQLYEIFARLVLSGRTEAVPPAMRRQLAKVGGDLREAEPLLRQAAEGWFESFLNGSPELTDPQRARWCSARLGQLRNLLLCLLSCGDAARRVSGERAETGVELVLDRLDELHREHLSEVERWLAVLVSPSCVDRRGEAGLCEAARLRRRQTLAQMRRDETHSWTHRLRGPGSEDRWSPEALYQRLITPFFQERHGLRLRHRWSCESTDPPAWTLELITAERRRYRPEAAHVTELLADLRATGSELVTEVATTTLIGNSSTHRGLADLVPWISRLTSEDARGGIEIQRNAGGADGLERRALLLLPRLPPTERQRLSREALDQASLPLSIADGDDLNTARLLVLDTAVPLSAVRLRGQPGEDPGQPHWICLPEQIAETVRHKVESQLGIVPCPPLHPLVRLLVAAPCSFADLGALLAEGGIQRRLTAEGEVVEITDGVHREVAAPNHNLTSVPLALLNIAYGVRGGDLVRVLVARFKVRTVAERSAAWAKALESLRRWSAAEPEGPQRQVLDQLTMLTELEALADSRQYGEEEPS